MRSKRKGNSAPRALLVGIGLPVLALFGLFSLVPYDRMTAQWPMGISSEEVHLYQHWFDQRPDTMAEVEVQRFELEATGQCEEEGEGEVVRRFKGWTREDSVLMSRDGDTWFLTFPDGRPLSGQHRVRLKPATMSSIRTIYANHVAHAYGPVTGGAALVRLVTCGDDRGIFLVEEVVTPEFVDRYGIAGAVLVDSALASVDSTVFQEAQRSLARFGTTTDATAINSDMAAATGVVLQAAGIPLSDGATAWYDPQGQGFIAAIGAMVPGSPATAVGTRALSSFLSTPHAHQLMRARAAELALDSARIADLLAEADAMYASAFVGDTRIGYVRAQLGQERKDFMRRLFHPEPEAAYGLAVVDTAEKTPPVVELDPFLRRYLVGDTVRIPRAKHVIDHVITVPVGIGVVLEKGARLNMAPGAGLVVNGSLHMRGTGLNPVFIRPAEDGAAWAGICVNGSGSTRCVINGLKMSGGSMYRSGDGDHIAMLSFHGCEVTITNSDISGAQGPAAVALARGALSMRDCAIGPGKDALLDVSFAQAVFIKCSFRGESTPNGARAKGAQMRFDDCGFLRFLSEGMTLNTRSMVALRRCTFTGNGTGVVAVDGTEVYADGCSFIGNTVAIDLHRSRAGQRGGQATVFQNTFTGNGSDKRVDDLSTWTLGIGKVPEVVSSGSGND